MDKKLFRLDLVLLLISIMIFAVIFPRTVKFIPETEEQIQNRIMLEQRPFVVRHKSKQVLDISMQCHTYYSSPKDVVVQMFIENQQSILEEGVDSIIIEIPGEIDAPELVKVGLADFKKLSPEKFRKDPEKDITILEFPLIGSGKEQYYLMFTMKSAVKETQTFGRNYFNLFFGRLLGPDNVVAPHNARFYVSFEALSKHYDGTGVTKKIPPGYAFTAMFNDRNYREKMVLLSFVMIITSSILGRTIYSLLNYTFVKASLHNALSIIVMLFSFKKRVTKNE